MNRATRYLFTSTALFLTLVTRILGQGMDGIPPRPSLFESLANSGYIVTGEVGKVEITRSKKLLSTEPESWQPWVHYRIEFHVHETLYGKHPRYGKDIRQVEILEIDRPAWRDDWDWVPKSGGKAIAFAYWIKAFADKNGVVFDAKSIRDYHSAIVAAVRNIGRILDMPAIDEQARAVAAGCFSRDRIFREWCMRTLAGKYDSASLGKHFKYITDLDSNGIHDYVGDQAAWDILARVCFDDQHDFEFLQFCDELLQEDPRYRNSRRRFEVVWSRVDAALRGPDLAQHSRLMWFFSQNLLAACPEYRDESFFRIQKLIRDTSLSPKVRRVGLVYLNLYCSDVTRNQVAELLASQLLGQDPLIAASAAMATADFVVSDARAGRTTPERLMQLVRNPEKCPEKARSRLRQAESEAKKIANDRRAGGDRAGSH